MSLLGWFLKWARAEKDETFSHHFVAVVLVVVTSVIVALCFNLGVGMCWVVFWTFAVWRPWRATPEFDLDKDKEKKD